MITLNLLPDIKKEYLKANRRKSMFMMVAFLVSATSVAAVALVAIYVLGVQKLQIANSQNSIDFSIKTLNETEDLDKIVTVQNQLNALPSLYEQKVVASKLFDYLKIVTPNEVRLSRVSVEYDDFLVEVRGTGEDFKAVNTFVDSLKNASFTFAQNDQKTLAFSSVVLDSISSDSEASFRVSFSYDPQIFDINVAGLKLTVPNITSTRSQTEKPKSLFDAPEAEVGP